MPTSARRTSSRAERPAAAKREAIQCDDHPDEVRTIRHGTAVPTSQKRIACPKAGPNRSSTDPPTPVARRATAPERAKAAFSFGPCTARFLFGQDRKGPPPRPARWGEEEQGSGRSFRRRRKRSLADFATTTMGGIPLDKPPCGSRDPVAAVRRPTFPTGG